MSRSASGVSAVEGPLMDGPRVLRLADNPHGVLEVGPLEHVPVALLFDGLDGEAYDRFCRSAGKRRQQTQLAVPNSEPAMIYALAQARKTDGSSLHRSLRRHGLDCDRDTTAEQMFAVMRRRCQQPLDDEDPDRQLDPERRCYELVLELSHACERDLVTMALLAGHLPRCARLGDREYVLWADAPLPQRFDLCSMDFRWRTVGLIDPDCPLAVEVHAAHDTERERRKTLAYPTPAQLHVHRFDTVDDLRDWVLAAASRHDGPMTTPDRRAILGPYLQTCSAGQTTTSCTRFTPGDVLDLFDYDDPQRLAERAAALGVAQPAAEVEELRAQVARAACARLPAAHLLPAGAGGRFVRTAEDAGAGTVDPRPEALESVACHTLPRGRFLHEGNVARPHRIADELAAVETFRPLNPFTAAG